MFVPFSFAIIFTFSCIHIKILQNLSFNLTTSKEMLKLFRIFVVNFAFFILFRDK